MSSDATPSAPPGLELTERVLGAHGILELYSGVCDDECGFLLTIVRDRLDETHADPFIRVADEILARRERIRIAHDWFAMTSYASLVRRAWTKWASARLKGLPDVHFLVRQKLIAMGIATAGMGISLVGGPRMVTHWSRESFNRTAFERLQSR